MSDDAIKAALREAGEATWQRIDQLGYEPPATPQAEKIAAAAVAAFLRALRHGTTIRYADDETLPGWSWDQFIGRDLAEAVEIEVHNTQAEADARLASIKDAMG